MHRHTRVSKSILDLLHIFIYWQEQIQLLADLNLKKTPQLVELVEDSKVANYFIDCLMLCNFCMEKL